LLNKINHLLDTLRLQLAHDEKLQSQPERTELPAIRESL